MASDIRNLIEEYQAEALFQENQAVQWRGLCAAFILDWRDDQESEREAFTLGSDVLVEVQRFDLNAIQQDDGSVLVTLTKAGDAVSRGES